MNEKILAYLKTRLNGVSNTYLEGVAKQWGKTITEEAQIETVLTDGVIDSIKYSATFMQTEGDRRATEATTTSVKTYEEKHKLKDGKPIDKADPEPDKTKGIDTKGTDAEAIKKIVAEAVAPLKEEVEGYRKAATGKVIKQKLVDKLKEEDVTDEDITAFNLLAGVTVEKEEDIESVATQIKDKLATQKQVLVDSGNYAAKPKPGSGPTEKTEADYKEIMDGKEEENIGKVDLGLTKSE